MFSIYVLDAVLTLPNPIIASERFFIEMPELNSFTRVLNVVKWTFSIERCKISLLFDQSINVHLLILF